MDNETGIHIKNILEKLEKNDFDAYLISQFTNLNYISGYLPTSFAFCIIKENPIIYVSKMDMEIANKTSSLEIKEFDSFSQMIKDLKEENIKNLAIEPSLIFSMYSKFANDFNMDSVNFINQERMIKSPYEISKISKATKIAQEAYKDLNLLDKLEKAIPEWKVAYELGLLMREKGASGESFDTIVASGTRSSLPHAVCTDKPLEKPILIDWGAKFDGYCSDNTRTIVFNEKQQEIFDIVLEAHDKAIKAVRPGLKACEIDKIARDIIKEYGYGENFIHSTGHSLGLDIHEEPSISSKDKTILENNMLITIEPGIYFEDNFGIRIEDTVLIDNKAKVIGNLSI